MTSPGYRALAGALFVLLPACGGHERPLLCGEIPAGGCPAGRGGACSDAECAALYDCLDGAWTVVARCDRAEPGGGAAGAGGDGGGASDQGGADGGCAQVALDHTGETAGCTPDLQLPDCPVAAAETCAVRACSTGCLDFFLCTGEGWTPVAYCTEAGQIVVTQ